MVEVDVQTSESHDARVARFTEQLQAALSGESSAPAPAQKPAVSEQVDEFPLPEPDFEPAPLVAGPAAYATQGTVPSVSNENQGLSPQSQMRIRGLSPQSQRMPRCRPMRTRRSTI